MNMQVDGSFSWGFSSTDPQDLVICLKLSISDYKIMWVSPLSGFV